MPLTIQQHYDQFKNKGTKMKAKLCLKRKMNLIRIVSLQTTFATTFPATAISKSAPSRVALERWQVMGNLRWETPFTIFSFPLFLSPSLPLHFPSHVCFKIKYFWLDVIRLLLVLLLCPFHQYFMSCLCACKFMMLFTWNAHSFIKVWGRITYLQPPKKLA